MADFKESEHPRDNKGRFTDGNTTDSKSIIIEGNELGDYSDIKELRQKAIIYYKENLQGNIVEREDIGKIRFSRKGRDEFSAFSANPDKLKIIPYLKDIIKDGKLGKFRELEHKRNDNIIGFYSINSNIILDKNNREIEVLIGKDKEGNLFYDFFIDRPKETRVHNGYLYTNYKSTTNSHKDILTNSSSNVNTQNETFELNIFIKEMKINNNFRIYNQETNRTIDNNGFMYVKKSPILRSGVLEYYGSELGDVVDGINLEKEKIYKVFIPPDELKKSMNTFKLIPIVNDHQWLGIEGKNAKNYQEGSTGEDVFIDKDLLMIDLKFTNLDTIKDIQDGIKEELSASYENKLTKAPPGAEYDFIATDIVANHLALVEKGRCGSSVRVLNSFINQKVENMRSIKIDDEEVSLEEAMKILKEETEYHKKHPVSEESEKDENKTNNKTNDEEKMTEKQENKKTCNVDKRELIREIMAIASKPNEDFKGGEDEKIETVAKLAEELGYNPSETSKEDNKSKSKNEEADDKNKSENMSEAEEDDKIKKDKKEEEEKDKSKSMNYDKIYSKMYNSIKTKIDEENKAKIRAYNNAKVICGEFEYTDMSELEILNKGLSSVGLEAENVAEANAMIKAYNSMARVDNSFSYESGGAKNTIKINF